MKKLKNVRLADDVQEMDLIKYGFFYHRFTDDYWFVLNRLTKNFNNVEVSIRINYKTKEVKLYATNDHKKLPSIYSKRYSKDNYLEFENEIDQFSFADWIDMTHILQLFIDGFILIK